MQSRRQPFRLSVQSYDVCKWWPHITLWPDGSVCLFAHNTTSLSSLCRSFWRYLIYKIHLRYIMSSLCLRLNQFSQFSFMQYMGLCVFSLPTSLMMTARINVLDLNIIMKSEVWPLCHRLGLGHETMVCTYVYLYSYEKYNHYKSTHKYVHIA